MSGKQENEACCEQIKTSGENPKGHSLIFRNPKAHCKKIPPILVSHHIISLNYRQIVTSQINSVHEFCEPIL